VGQLEGFAALTPDYCLRKLLVEKLDPFTSALAKSDIDSLSGKDLNAIYRASSDFDTTLDQLRRAVEHGRRLLLRENVEQLAAFAVRAVDYRAFQQFTSRLPSKVSAKAVA